MMSSEEKLKEFAAVIQEQFHLNTGFSPVVDRMLDPGVRKSCEMNSCGAYGKNWMCPPHIGKVEDLIAKVKEHENILIFQGIYQLEDSFDFEGMMRGSAQFKEAFQKIAALAREQLPEALILGAGGCTLCPVCAVQTNEPCRFPDLAYPSVESYGFQVSILAQCCGLKYINGANTVTYFGGILI
ncbi:MAG: DUF2284 domain-containing protein [Massiliimalia sp.]